MARFGPFGPAPALAAGVSGGPHSLALALLAAAWARARGGDLLALIVEHGLRPDSAAEAAHVVAMLQARGIPSRILPLGLRPGPAVQARARAARLEALLAAAGAAGRVWLLLGQHAGDQAETLLLRGLAGSGGGGLAGMAPLRATAPALLLRPLLGAGPARLEATVAAAGLTPVRDPSNADPRSSRVRVRAALSAAPVARDALVAASLGFGRRRATREAAVAARLAGAAVLHATGDASLDLAALGDDAVADAALAALVRAVGGGAYAPAAAATAALRRRGGGTLGGTRLRRAGLRHHLAREAAAVAPPVAALPGALWDGRWRLDGPGDAACMLGALGPGRGATERAAACALGGPGTRPDGRASELPRLPAAVRTSLPAIRRDGALVAVPPLDYPDPATCRRFVLRFAPAAGPVVAAWDMADAGNPPHVSLAVGEPAAQERDRDT